MERIYLDNAATTAIRQEVIDEMVRVMQDEYGNPSSTHSVGRAAKAVLETSRKTIAKHINALASELIFTSSATEATNWILKNAVENLGITRIITSKIEHHATLYTVNQLKKSHSITIDFVAVLPDGTIDYQHLESLLQKDEKTLVALLHVNNETGVVNDVKKIGELCSSAKAIFFCDTVQSIGKMNIDVNDFQVDYLVSSAHKFHGPKGVGFAYVKKNSVMQPMILGGEQEKGWRAGTEAVHQIAGMAKALELSSLNLETERKSVETIKNYCWKKLTETFPGVTINGSNTFYTILNVLLPFDASKTAMILFNLDIKGIAVSRGSACQSGSIKPSHVLAEMLLEEDLKKPSIRISFSHFNTTHDIDLLISALQAV